MELQKYMTAAELAEVSGLDPSQVRRLLGRGVFPGAVKTAGVWFIPEDVARSWLRSRAERKAGARRRKVKN